MPTSWSPDQHQRSSPSRDEGPRVRARADWRRAGVRADGAAPRRPARAPQLWRLPLAATRSLREDRRRWRHTIPEAVPSRAVRAPRRRWRRSPGRCGHPGLRDAGATCRRDPVLKPLELLLDEPDLDTPRRLGPEACHDYLYQRVLAAGAIGPCLANRRFAEFAHARLTSPTYSAPLRGVIATGPDLPPRMPQDGRSDTTRLRCRWLSPEGRTSALRCR
jgi:hypothetical protein